MPKVNSYTVKVKSADVRRFLTLLTAHWWLGISTGGKGMITVDLEHPTPSGHSPYWHLAKNLQLLRNQRSLSVSELARKAKVPVGAVKQAESTRQATNLRFRHLLAITKALQVDFSQLLEGS